MIEGLDVDAAKAVLLNWLDAWRGGNWERMARYTSSPIKDVGERAAILSSSFHHRRITEHAEPNFKDGDRDARSEDDIVGWADFEVSVTLAEGHGSESFVARVIGVGVKWGVNAVSTMKRTISPAGKEEQWQNSQKAHSSQS